MIAIFDDSNIQAIYDGCYVSLQPSFVISDESTYPSLRLNMAWKRCKKATK